MSTAVLLSEVTLCAADCAQPQLAARALKHSMAGCAYGDAILFSDIATPGPFRTVQIPSLRSRADYSKFILKDLAPHICTPFVLIVQWDGYVLAPHAWSPEFQNYDYLGARWPWHSDGQTVGNGGFSLRSRKLLTITANANFPPTGHYNEDEFVCRILRAELEQKHGIRFAPESLADRFSYERAVPETPTFGFHGLFNMWRHVQDDEIVQIVDGLRPQALRSREFIELLAQYAALRKFMPAAALFSRLRAFMSLDDILAVARESLGDHAVADALVRACDRWTVALQEPQ